MDDYQKTGDTASPGVDHEIASLLGIQAEATTSTQAPDFNSLFEGAGGPEKEAGEEVDLIKKSFAPITKFNDTPKAFFKDKQYYQKLLTGEGDVSQRFHGILSSFLKASDPQDRSLYRGRLIPAFWNLAGSIAQKIHGDLPIEKTLLLRFGVVLPRLISEDQRGMLASVVFQNETAEPVNYVDEWLKNIALGLISPSVTDETKVQRKTETQKVNTLLEKTRGQKNVHIGLIKSKIVDIKAEEKQLIDRINYATSHSFHSQYEGLAMPYAEEQKKALIDAGSNLRKLILLDRELQSFYFDLEKAAKTLAEVERKQGQLGDTARVVNGKGLQSEFNTIRQMAKMCVGRQGNHFPLAMQQFFRANMQEIASRENVITQMAMVEALDQGLFERTFKRQTNRIVPYVIIIPCYGDQGICWEPFERYNRATSRGRIAVPLFPKDLRVAVISALADLRWQVAKEKSQHYWMEEGLTGRYYQWFEERIKRGDVKEYFIRDYLLWITKESEGTQKLDKDVRGIFWRYMPFPQHLKDVLRNRGFVYNELYKKDQNRSMSDGY